MQTTNYRLQTTIITKKMSPVFMYSFIFLWGLVLGPQLSVAQSSATCNKHGFSCMGSQVFRTCVDGGPPVNPQQCKEGKCDIDCPVECSPVVCSRCNTNKYFCVNETTYKYCRPDTDIPEEFPLSCERGKVCDMNCNSALTCDDPAKRCPVTCTENVRLPIAGKTDGYYVCTVNDKKEVTVSEYPCQSGTWFDADKKVCTAHTTTAPSSMSSSSMSSSPTEPTPVDTFNCIAIGRFQHPTDCKKFYSCALSPAGVFNKTVNTCPIWSFFNVFTSLCCYDSNVCRVGSRPRVQKSSSSSTGGLCTSDTERFEDPASCDNYYLCAKIGDVLVPHRYSCPEGSVFSPVAGSCTKPENYKCEK